MRLSDPVTSIKGVGPQLNKILESNSIYTVDDLLHYFPRRYDDYSDVVAIKSVKPGPITLQTEIKQISARYVRGGLHITEAVVSDETGSLRAVWFNQPYRQNTLKKGQAYYISGKLEFKSGRLALINPSVELVSSFPVNTARIVPIYPERKGLTSLMLRRLIGTTFSAGISIDETLPDSVIAKYNLIPLSDTIRNIHFPASTQHVAQARRRLGFEELFELILASQYSRMEISKEQALAITFNQDLAREFVSMLPYKLTNAQRKAAWQIYQDMSRLVPMNRLLEGDVGSGKTVVAAMAIAMTMHNGLQAALMAPTEILATQHAESIQAIFAELGMSDQIVLITGSQSPAQKNIARQKIAEGVATCIIGTHTLIQESVDMHSLALVIIDEQHRFGVAQRKQLIKKAGHTPHMLSMTATPIPRSLALTIFGELDISLLDEKPGDRQPIETRLVPKTDRLKVYKRIKEELDNGRQMFVVCPLIETSQSGLARASLEDVYADLSTIHFKAYRVAVLHGKMKPADKNKVMQDFIEAKIDILVATTVIEVGVNVPNASIMLIESPEVFGLAQLHQLRGRVGRGIHGSHCYLMLSDNGAPSKRLQAIESTTDGFKLAELDLSIRGAGALYGSAQHGIMDLRIADFTDHRLIAEAREAAINFIKTPANLIQYKHIKKRILELQHVVHLN